MNIKVYWVLYWKVKDITLHLMLTFPILTVLNTYVSVCSNIDRYDMPIKIKQVNYSTSQNTLWHNFDHETDLIPFIESYISHWTLGSSRWFDYFQYIYVLHLKSIRRWQQNVPSVKWKNDKSTAPRHFVYTSRRMSKNAHTFTTDYIDSEFGWCCTPHLPYGRS